MLFLPLLQLSLCLLPQVAIKQCDANKVVADVLQQWDKNQQSIRNAYFEIALTYEGGHKMDYFMQVHLLFKDKDECWLKANQHRKGYPTELTYLCRGNLFCFMYHNERNLHRTHLTGSFDRKALVDLCALIGAVPLFTNREQLAKENQLTVARKDEHYTWLNLVPLQTKHSWSIAQLGVINYESKWGPRYFPVIFRSRDLGNALHTWTFNKVVLNDDKIINEDCFQDDQQVLKQRWKLTESKSPTLWESWFLRPAR